MRVSLGRLLSAPLLASLLAVVPAGGQEQEPIESGLVERAGRRVIQLDVSFTPRRRSAGVPLPQLGPEDFDLVINGRRMSIEYADRVCDVEHVAVEDSVERSRAAVPAAPTPVRRATYIFYLEHTLLSMMGQDNALEMTERMVRELIREGDRGMIVSSGRRVIQSEFSEDPRELLDSIQEIREDTLQMGEFAYVQSEESRYEDILGQPTERLKKLTARAYQTEETRITASRLRRLSAIVGGLAEVDPPKAVFYFADAVRSRPGEHYLEPFLSAGPAGAFTEGNPLRHTFSYDEVIHAANAQGARFYTVQAQGQHLFQRVRMSDRDNRGGTTRFQDAENTMHGFAAETGGEMFFGGTDEATMDRILSRIEQDFGCMYLLSFYPTELPEDRSLRVILRLDGETDAARKVDEHFKLNARGQMVVQSASTREQSLLLAAHLASATVDSELGRGAVIPVDFDGEAYTALAQFVVRDAADLPEGVIDGRSWDLGMTRVVETNADQRVSRRVDVTNSSVPIVLETMWSFPPGSSEIISVGREQRLGQLATAQLELEWPDPDRAKASISPIAAVQETDGVFLRMDGGEEAPVRHRGLLGAGETEADTGRPLQFIELVCRGKRVKTDLWVQRRLIDTNPREFDVLTLRKSGGRCIRVRDVVAEGKLTPGRVIYEVAVYDNPALRGEAVARRTREIDMAGDTTDPEAEAAVARIEKGTPPMRREPPTPRDAPEASSRETAPEISRARLGPFTDPPADLPSLDTILDGMARVASLYVDKALSFTADERTEVFTHFRGLERSYVAPIAVYCYYDTGRGRLNDRRIQKSHMSGLKKRMARGEDVSAELLDAPDPMLNNTAIPAYVLRPFTWMVLFSREAQAGYRYRIAGTVKRGVWLSLEPANPEPDSSDWYGEVLVDLETYQILMAQGYQHKSIEELRHARAMIRSDRELPQHEIDRTFVEMNVRTEFKQEARGIRLPSKVSTQIYHHTVVQPIDRKYSKKRQAYEIVQKYKHYEFFGVRVEDQITGLPRPGD